MEKVRRMAFYEIAGGKFADDVQRAFEDAQQEMLARSGKVVVQIAITMIPPPPGDPNFGGIKYALATKYPKVESREFTTELQNGVIVQDGESVVDMIQQRLEFPDIAPTNQKQAGR